MASKIAVSALPTVSNEYIYNPLAQRVADIPKPEPIGIKQEEMEMDNDEDDLFPLPPQLGHHQLPASSFFGLENDDYRYAPAQSLPIGLDMFMSDSHRSLSGVAMQPSITEFPSINSGDTQYFNSPDDMQAPTYEEDEDIYVEKKPLILDDYFETLVQESDLPHDYRKFYSDIRNENMNQISYFVNIRKIDATSHNNYAARLAIEQGNVQVLDFLIKYGGVPPNFLNDLPIRLAAEKGDVAIVDYLLKYPGVDPAAKESYSLTMAATRGFTEIVYLLLQDGRANPAAEFNRPIRNAVKNGHVDTADLLLNQAAVDPSVFDDICLRTAVNQGNLFLVKLLLHNPRVSPQGRNNLAVLNAIKKGYMAIFDLLINDSRVDKNVNGIDILTQLAKRGESKRIQELLKQTSLDPSSGYDKLLKIATIFGRESTVYHLLQDPRVGSKEKSHIRSRVYSGNCVSVMSEETALDKISDCSALRIAALRGQASIVQLLVRDRHARFIEMNEIRTTFEIVKSKERLYNVGAVLFQFIENYTGRVLFFYRKAS